MKKRFFDLHVFPNPKNCGEMASTARDLGFKALGASVKEDSGLEPLRGILGTMERAGIEALRRSDLSPATSRRFFVDVEKARRSFDLVAAECSTRRDLALATKSHVDILFVQPGAFLRLREADLKPLAGSGKSFELNLMPLLRKRGLETVHELSHVARCLAWLLKLKVRLILSSGAASPLELRAPRDIASFFFLVDLGFEEALKGLSTNPGTLLEAVRARKASITRLE